MKRKTHPFAAAMMGLALALSIPLAAQAEEKKEYKDLALKDDAKCTRCHDETESYPVLAIGKTKHGTRADGRTPTCTTCHGESDTHINKPEGVTERPKVEIGYGKKSTTPVEERNKVCLTCHQGGRRIHWQMSAHDARGVACASCHQVHTAHDKARDKATQADVCFTCHKEVRVQVTKPARHPIQEGKVSCSDCHNPHGTAGVKMLVRDTVNDTCFQCHMEKRGPFLWNHQPVTEDCSICHNPHGTTNDSMLKLRAPFLCQQCHEPTSHRGRVPSANLGAADDEVGIGITLARGCVNCHTNIHGGSNPVNNSGSRSFRR